MRVVLDTNVLLISLPLKSKYRPIFDSLRAGEFELIVSNDILLEYHEKISEKTSPEIAENVIKLILSLENCTLQSTFFEWGLMHNDEDDNKYTDCSLVANADHLVSEDRHFNILKDIDFPKLSVIRADDFLELVKPQ
ncbi:putative toxin-antitoxin system toxin component, PIN family [Dyadobacter fanqingshengii]|uniref:Toxin-antitoxin system toxin component, PIN family n=1 Tax=Dyadobacter fanqingshengii TaxID=2906443 RepID=A0A9X1PGC2_9BACT|nr:putative toxin-antitoxin system toxin component, PIN family [Dyadobacter fanqingshengii]MCF0042762.1 putative toxin-antitoxin system toxin component, PIN family [Dyadobacter fanqingshengii]USJ36016.1 putative toxin-antitoxin system toxin component, PIN family [Dyadobacter fanqingshengii]